MKRATKSETINKMDRYEQNEVLPVGETPSFEKYFGSSTSTDPWSIITSKRYLHLACSNNIYLLLPTFERVKIVGFLVEPLAVEKVDVAPKEFFTSARDLVLPHVRKDGKLELRGVKVEGGYVAHSHDNVSYFDQDRKFVDDFLVRPLKRVSVGDVVMVVPSYEKFVVIGLSADGSGLSLVSEQREGEGGSWYRDRAFPPVVVEFERVRVVQEFLNSGGFTINLLLLPDFRGIN